MKFDLVDELGHIRSCRGGCRREHSTESQELLHLM